MKSQTINCSSWEKHVAANPDLFSSRPKTAKVTHPNPTQPPAPASAHAPAPT